MSVYLFFKLCTYVPYPCTNGMYQNVVPKIATSFYDIRPNLVLIS